MSEEFYMKEEDAKGILNISASIQSAIAYCKRCSSDIEREENSANCQRELELLAEAGVESDVSIDELLHTCRSCDYKAAYIADALNT